MNAFFKKACKDEHLEIIKLLIKKDVDFMIKDNYAARSRQIYITK